MQKLIWLSFDLGVRGDYEGMYAWLDSHKAKECGDSVAVFYYEFNGDLKKKLSADLKKAVHTDNNTRVYIIWLLQGKMKGGFIIGRRKAAPWSGFGPQSSEEPDYDQ
jgi:hypothetical protein